jgi:hypothetical protein
MFFDPSRFDSVDIWIERETLIYVKVHYSHVQWYSQTHQFNLSKERLLILSELDIKRLDDPDYIMSSNGIEYNHVDGLRLKFKHYVDPRLLIASLDEWKNREDVFVMKNKNIIKMFVEKAIKFNC